MPKFRKKPVVIDAEQYDGMDPLGWGDRGLPFEAITDDSGIALYVRTLEGSMRVMPGDWVITGVQGEKYPCKPDIFEATYEPVKDAPLPDERADSPDIEVRRALLS